MVFKYAIHVFFWSIWYYTILVWSHNFGWYIKYWLGSYAQILRPFQQQTGVSTP